MCIAPQQTNKQTNKQIWVDGAFLLTFFRPIVLPEAGIGECFVIGYRGEHQLGPALLNFSQWEDIIHQRVDAVDLAVAKQDCWIQD